MKFTFIVIAVLLSSCAAVPPTPTWNAADAVRDAEQDIQSGHIKFYWAGTIGARPVDVPFAIAQRYPHGDAGIGCVVFDPALRDRQYEYAKRYNARMLAYVRQRR